LTKYPFEDDATLANEFGRSFEESTFLDAAFYPVGGRAGLYISQVEITNTLATITVGDSDNDSRCSATFTLGSPPDELRFIDGVGRGAGVLISESLRLAVFQTWAVGIHEFGSTETGFVTACCMPVPAIGVQAIQLEDGTLLSGDVWIMGDDGVVLSCDTVELPLDCDPDTEEIQYVIRVDIVGDPLFLRKVCAPGRFETPRFLERITFQKGGKSYQCGPGELGNINISPSTHTAEDTILRVRATAEGLVIETAGEKMKDIR
jgi:hypothetical protein